MNEEKVSMMEGSYTPKPFKGQMGEDVETFLQDFDKYIAYRELNDRKALALLKVLLKDGAGEWLERLDGYSRDNLRELRSALTERYGRSKIVKHKTARELFSRKQGPDEDLETFISACLKLSSSFGAEAESMAMYAIMGGLRPHLASFVAQKQPGNLKELIEQARLADMTVSPVTDQPMLLQMTEMKAELQRLGSKLEKATTSQVRESSPGSSRRVHFDDASARPRSSSPTYERQRGGRGGRGGRRPWSGRSWNDRQTRSAPEHNQRQDCSRCGWRGGHDHPNRCRAINLDCRLCGKIGHFARKCRSAGRQQESRVQNQQ